MPLEGSGRALVSKELEGRFRGLGRTSKGAERISKEAGRVSELVELQRELGGPWCRPVGPQSRSGGYGGS